jgi:hypothetical protein
VVASGKVALSSYIVAVHRLCGLSDYDDVALYFHVFAKFQ